MQQMGCEEAVAVRMDYPKEKKVFQVVEVRWTISRRLFITS